MRGDELVERPVAVTPQSASREYPATRMVLNDAGSSFVTERGAVADGRLVRLGTHPFARGSLRNVYRMLDDADGTTAWAV